VDARQSRRVQATGALMSLLRSPDVRAKLRHPYDQREHEVIVALPDDNLRYVCERVHAVGGSATVAVCVAPEGNQFHLVTMDVSNRPAQRREPCDDHLGIINGESPVSFALEYMDQARLKTMSFHMKSPDYTLDVVDSGDVAPVCA
jgi:hypothetical protein